MMLEDKTVCGPLCQHPSCWDSQRRTHRRLPRRIKPIQHRSLASTSYHSDVVDEYDLPKQTVVNLLDDYGHDPEDRYPSKFQGRPLQERSKSIISALELQSQASTTHHAHRPITRESSRKGRAPQATPASTTPTNKHMTHEEGKRRMSMANMEVQEVFEFEELNRNWNETFEKKQYYVWVPNPKRKKKRRKSTGDAIQRVDRQNRVTPKDITEQLVPYEVQTQRESTVQFDDVWPVYKRRPPGLSRGSTQSQFINISEPPPAEKRESNTNNQYYGIYEMLDLPRDVLADILDNVDERHMLNREKFAEALVDALPKLQENNKVMALASSDVLQQKPMPILDGRLKPSRQTTDPRHSRQIFQMDNELIERMSDANKSVELSSADMLAQFEDSPRLRPIPPIAVEKPAKVRTIALGLPALPSGVKHTRAFKYNDVQHDFSLGPIPTPPQRSLHSASSRTSDGGSTIHATMPSVRSDDETFTYYRYHERSSWATEESPAFNMSHSAQFPGAPTNTPHTFFTESQSPSPNKATRNFQSPHGAPLPPVNTPAGPAVTELTSMTAADLTAGALGTIAESDQADTQERVNQGPPPRSGKSVRFARDLSSAEQSDLDVEAKSCSKSETSLSVNIPTTMAGERNGKTSQWSRRSLDDSAPPSRGITKASSLNSISPEPWPQVNEAEFDKSPSPPPPRTPGTVSTIADAESMTVNLDLHSEKTPLSSVALRSALASRESAMKSRDGSRSGLQSRESAPGRVSLSRESTMHSEKAVKLMEAPVVDSPGPPPPSPEPKDHISLEGLTKENTGVSQLEDILETDSEFTISARPPSNLDDSALQTPVPSARQTTVGKHSQLAQYLGNKGRELSMELPLEEENAERMPVLAHENSATTVPSDSITIAETHSDVPRTASTTIYREESIVDAKTLAQSSNLTNSVAKTNSVARVAPTNRLAASNSVARVQPTRTQEALDLVSVTAANQNVPFS